MRHSPTNRTWADLGVPPWIGFLVWGSFLVTWSGYLRRSRTQGEDSRHQSPKEGSKATGLPTSKSYAASGETVGSPSGLKKGLEQK
jgi:hypothetical protein